MPTPVQSVPGTGTSGTVVDITLAPTAAGNTLIVAIGAAQDDTNPVVSGITLGGVALSLAKAVNNNAQVDCEQWYLADIAGGQTAVVVTFTAGTGPDINYDVLVMEWPGIVTALPLDKTNGANATSSSWSTGSSGTLAQASEVIIGAVFAEGDNAAPGITGPGSPWTLLTSVSSSSIAELLVGYLVVSATTAVTYSGTMSGPSPVYGAVIATFKLAAAAPGGTVQPRATLAVPRRRPRRGQWQSVTGQAFVKVAAPAQQPGPARRRRPARASVRFVPVATVNAVPVPPVAGTVQPAAAVPAPRRKAVRALVRFVPVATVNATPSGTVQPRAAVPVPRRRPARAVARGIAVPGLRGQAPAQQCRTPPRRRRARAWVRFTPVATVNALPVRRLLVSLASQEGTDDYGNTFPVGVQAGSSLDGPQVALIPQVGQASELQFPISDPPLTANPNVAGNANIADGYAVMEVSGAELAASGFQDWVQLALFSDDTAGDGAHMDFRFIDTTGSVTVTATYNASGWTFQDPVTINNTLDVVTTLTAGALNVTDGSTFGQLATFDEGISTGNVFMSPPMAIPSGYPYSTDSNTGSTWATGERNFINQLVDGLNDLVTSLINRGFIT